MKKTSLAMLALLGACGGEVEVGTRVPEEEPGGSEPLPHQLPLPPDGTVAPTCSSLPYALLYQPKGGERVALAIPDGDRAVVGRYDLDITPPLQAIVDVPSPEATIADLSVERGDYRFLDGLVMGKDRRLFYTLRTSADAAMHTLASLDRASGGGNKIMGSGASLLAAHPSRREVFYRGGPEPQREMYSWDPPATPKLLFEAPAGVSLVDTIATSFGVVVLTLEADGNCGIRRPDTMGGSALVARFAGGEKACSNPVVEGDALFVAVTSAGKATVYQVDVKGLDQVFGPGDIVAERAVTTTKAVQLAATASHLYMGARVACEPLNECTEPMEILRRARSSSSPSWDSLRTILPAGPRFQVDGCNLYTFDQTTNTFERQPL